ncbi:excisionase family DNA-binding protein [Mycolicibacterium neoaurum]|uniref:excisionase family DNA-binding protein n=1 Tax=Mycolicibacterium neoaurum TaxID=1795 RepID=UPI003556D185
MATSPTLPNRHARRNPEPAAERSVGRRWATTQKAAEYLGVTDRTIRQMVADGRLRAYRSGGRVVRIDLNELDAAMEPFGGAV